MRTPVHIIAALFLITASAFAATMSQKEVIAMGESVADSQLAQSGTATNAITWVPAVMWAGYADFSHVSSKKDYAAAIEALGASLNWTPRLNPKSPFHADDLCIAQAFLDTYLTHPDPARIAPVQARLDSISDHILTAEPPFAAGAKNTDLTWWWCDALFMAPPGHARLAAITGNKKYLDAMDKEWFKTADLLYDNDEHLFFRDKSYLGKLTKNGKKIFWTRGNGWVFAGLARTLTYLPKDYPNRTFYEKIFKEMAAKLASIQQPDGTWRPSLIDPDEFPDPETSGTALDCFAFAWGIANGLLDRDTYLPVATKAWAALIASRRSDGLIGYVQAVGAAPADVHPADTQLYATGAFLMSATQLSKLAPFEMPPLPRFSIQTAQVTGTSAK